jgi:predicted transcriptional regulator of viral defense system
VEASAEALSSQFTAASGSGTMNMRNATGKAAAAIHFEPKNRNRITKAWIDERPFMVTDREKTIIDALDMPRLAGGIGIVSEALRASWPQLDEKRLRESVVRIGNSAVAKRLGFLMEAHGVGDSEALRKAARLAPGYVPTSLLLPVGAHQET